MFEMLTGRMPFTDESPLGLMLEVVKAEIPDVREINADVDPEIARILDRMIAKDPAERYQNCHELISELSVHPLVAKGGPISLKPKISTAAATMIGQKTPVSAQTSLPSTPRTPAAAQNVANTRITPSGLPVPPVAANAGSHQSVLDRTTTTGTPRSSMLPWAIAAILALVLGGGAYAMRDRIPGFGTASTAQANATTTMPAPSAPPATSAAVAANTDDEQRQCGRNAGRGRHVGCGDPGIRVRRDDCIVRCGAASADRCVRRFGRAGCACVSSRCRSTA